MSWRWKLHKKEYQVLGERLLTFLTTFYYLGYLPDDFIDINPVDKGYSWVFSFTRFKPVLYFISNGNLVYEQIIKPGSSLVKTGFAQKIHYANLVFCPMALSE